MSQAAVVTPHHLSASAAEHILRSGGNAVDAAIAAVAAQGVVAPETSGVGGDLFALIHRPGWERPRTLNSSGRAGSNADPEKLRAAGHTEIPWNHPLGVTIPGCVDGLETLSNDLGALNLSEALQPAITFALDGFEVTLEQAGAFARQAPLYSSNPAVADFYPDGHVVDQGDVVSRHDLARTLQAVADGGRSAFYEGDIGQDIVAASQGNITLEDLRRPVAEWIEPVGVEIGDLNAWTTPPNSQGYLGPATLAVFEMLDPPEDVEDPLWWHLLIESYRCLAWERDDVVADPDHAPLGAELLIDRSRLERAASSVSPNQTGVWPRMGPASGTAYLCVADHSGMAVSIIQSNYRGTGSPYGADRSGFLLQDRGLGFTLTPGHPNELLPGKRPLHTLSPTLWTEQAEPRWILGTRGGAVQPQLIAQVAARSVLGNQEIDVAQAAPRWTVTDFGPFSDASFALEPGASPTLIEVLQDKGHRIDLLEDPQPGWGPLSIIGIDGDRRIAASDPRVDTTTALIF
ncbi:MAG: gamma-glutamyltransferase [Acidimicrobiia bacterium]